ncbi:AAA family ATPase [Sulfidibacter corallicola]|uniref:AAA family ATPase n=1 Tax=Sulfidibacter corallicola TaxID=2818388 RepID=A0A8A4TUV3_SULCO|nr:AAA family ATPase [Sulfidibacter corallicola]QTD53746.1 AAA family ATPase [Sulfidibacter corallicola]
MKVASLSLKYFKKFHDQTFSFKDPETGDINNLIVLYGDNATGKSSILQSIAATLGVATGRLRRAGELEWPGFHLELANKSWQFPYEVALGIHFSKPELAAACDYFSRVPDFAENPEALLPSQEQEVELSLVEGKVSAPSRGQYFQFRGREYARKLVRQAPEGFDLFKHVGSVFWYNEFRGSSGLQVDEHDDRRMNFDENTLRRRLADWMYFHQRVIEGKYQLRPGQRDLYHDLEQAFKTLFPNHSFEGAVSRESGSEVPWFFLYDGQNQYEISEMSSGERAIIPLIFDFAFMNIHNSVILIDEVEQHLNPELQLALLNYLPRLGLNNQFFLTTHSDVIADAVPEYSVIDLNELEASNG